MKKGQIKIVYFGTPEFSAYILEQLISHPWGGSFSIQAVVTRPDKAVGRHQALQQSPVVLVAEKYGIPVLKPTKLDEEFIKNHISLLECDLFIVASYGKIIPKALLDIPRLGALNVHGSILPKYRGASPIQAAILNGDKETGVTIMLMDEQMDHGPVLSTEEINISKEDNYQTLSNKMMQVGSQLLLDTLPKFIERRLKPNGQNHAMASFCPLIKKDDGYFDLPAGRQVSTTFLETLDRMIRAYYPWPGVWCKWNNKIVKLVPAKAEIYKDKFLIQMEGKKAIPIKDFLNGYPNFPLKKP